MKNLGIRKILFLALSTGVLFTPQDSCFCVKANKPKIPQEVIESINAKLDKVVQNWTNFCSETTQEKRNETFKIAAKYGHVGVIQKFVKTPRLIPLSQEEIDSIKIEIKPDFGLAGIILAAMQKQEQIKALQEEKPFYSKKACEKAFMTAVRKNHPKVVELMAQNNWIEKNSLNKTLIRLQGAKFAMVKKRSNLVFLLLKTNKNISSSFLQQILLEAVAYNCVDVVREMLSRYKSFVRGLTVKDGGNVKFDVLAKAAINGFQEITELLLKTFKYSKQDLEKIKKSIENVEFKKNFEEVVKKKSSRSFCIIC